MFHANKKAWSGDHCVDPSLVPGILFCNRVVENENPRLIDIGPTVLSMFGAAVPDYMDGKVLTVRDAAESPPSEQPSPLPRPPLEVSYPKSELRSTQSEILNPKSEILNPNT